ncbi:cytochrome c [Pseudomonas sp. T8]|uniref:c-type cytochrome n=1 Tax=Pseudomonas sp. T8 TaxID=645292 RepID=UPI002148601A|nr:cytochrome c [Pseudomonas sp. T8]UUT22915.1 cytochrome c [Pseudomonas sp. T8]
MKNLTSACLLLLGYALTGQAADESTLLATCNACHGAQGEGNVTLGAPRLAGQHASYLSQQLQNLKAGKRGYDPQDNAGATMRAIAQTLSNTQIDDLSARFAALPSPPVSSGPLDGYQKGAALYQHTCAGCHGPVAEGFAFLKTPNLRILDDWYIDKQLSNYVRGVRGSDQHADQLGVWMRGISLQVNEAEERQSIIGYIGTLSAKP